MQQNGYVEAYADKLTGTKGYLDFPSVKIQKYGGAYMQKELPSLKMQQEPEIVDLANYLNKMNQI